MFLNNLRKGSFRHVPWVPGGCFWRHCRRECAACCECGDGQDEEASTDENKSAWWQGARLLSICRLVFHKARKRNCTFTRTVFECGSVLRIICNSFCLPLWWLPPLECSNFTVIVVGGWNFSKHTGKNVHESVSNRPVGWFIVFGFFRRVFLPQNTVLLASVTRGNGTCTAVFPGPLVPVPSDND